MLLARNPRWRKIYRRTANDKSPKVLIPWGFVIPACPDDGVNQSGDFHKASIIDAGISLTASADSAAGCAEIATILADHRVIATFATQFASSGFWRGTANRCLENAHLLQG